jgi:eukaryotic-like serine/threonine-protein kinase
MVGSQLGSYRIIEKLGEGGMGIVYKAVDTSLDRVVAVKSLSAELAKNPDLEQRFRAEAKAQANLSHTNITTLYAFFVEQETAWMVMEYIEGETFHDMIQRRGPIPAETAIPLFKQALLGIGYAHRMGIVHRDIKPSNIMVKRDGIVKVMDFGIAKVLGNRGMTRTGTQMGTAYYMSPEQVVNKGVDVRSDVYSLGVTLFEILTANLPFTGDTDFEVMQAHMQTPPPVPTRFYPYIPKGIENAVLQAMAKRPDDRFQTVEEFGMALERPEDFVPRVAPVAVAGSPITSVPRNAPAATQTMHPAPLVPTPPTGVMMPPPATSAPAASNKMWMLIAGGCAVVALASIAFSLRPKPQPAPIVSQNPVTPGPGSGSPQGQIEVPIPLPPEQKKPEAKAPAATPSPAAGSQQQPAQQTTASPQPQAMPPATPPATPPPAANTTPAPPPAGTAPAPPVTPAAPAPPAGPVTVPAGTRITVRTIGMASTRSSKLGDAISAAVDSPIVVGARIAIPRGTDASLRVASMDDGISLALSTLSIGGRQFTLTADTYSNDGSGKKKGVLGRVGGLVRKKKPEGGEAVVIPPESRLTFTLAAPLDLP